jgi:hypothetical protein
MINFTPKKNSSSKYINFTNRNDEKNKSNNKNKFFKSKDELS